MNLMTALLSAAIGYLLGSVSFARLVTKLVAPGHEVTGIEFEIPRTQEPVQVEAIAGTAVASQLGDKYGGLTGILDILKVAIPTLVFKMAYPGTPYFLITASAGLMGHNWPLYHRFKGGRGISAIYGGFFVIDWIGTLVTSIASMFLGLVVLRHVLVDYGVLVAYTGGIWLMIPWLWFRTRDVAHLAYVVFVNVIFAVAMIPDIKMMRDLKRRGVQADFARQMDVTPMGRGLKKMANWFGLLQEKR